MGHLVQFEVNWLVSSELGICCCRVRPVLADLGSYTWDTLAAGVALSREVSEQTSNSYVLPTISSFLICDVSRKVLAAMRVLSILKSKLGVAAVKVTEASEYTVMGLMLEWRA